MKIRGWLRGITRSRTGIASFFFGILILLASPVPGRAQVSASISGKVDDASGAAVSGATVTVREIETDAKRVVTTDATGNYRVLSLASRAIRAECGEKRL